MRVDLERKRRRRMVYTKEQYQIKIRELEDEITKQKGYLASVCQEYAESVCPFKIGERITSDDGKCKAEITRIKYVSRVQCQYELYGRWILKDGELGLQVHDLYRFPHPLNP